MSHRSSSPEIEGAIGGEGAKNSAVDSDNLVERMTTNEAAVTEMDSFYHNNKQDLMFELRQIRHGEKPVTGQEHRDKINNFLSKVLQVQTQTEGKDNVPANVDSVEEHRPEAIVVEVEGLYERRPVSSLLHSNAFRRQLDNIIRRGVSGLSVTPQSRTSSYVSVNPVPNIPAPRAPPVTPAQELRHSRPSSQSERHVLPPPTSLPHRPQDHSQLDEQEQQHVQDVPDSRPDDIPSPLAPYFDQMRPSQEDTVRIQRETIIQEISELVHQGLVSSSLDGSFRGTLEVLMEDRLGVAGINSGERVRDIIHSLPRDPLHRRNDFSNLGLPVDDDLDNISVTTVSASAVPYNQTNHHLRREVASLKNEITEMKDMLKMNLELQLDIQRAIRQEVAAAVSQATIDQATSVQSSSAERRYRPVNESDCLICLENPVNSVLYQCGHMCVCYCCGKHLIHQGAKCPICRAPIKDIIQAFSCNGK